MGRIDKNGREGSDMRRQDGKGFVELWIGLNGKGRVGWALDGRLPWGIDELRTGENCRYKRKEWEVVRR